MSQTGDLETDIMNHLQRKKRGQTIEELSQYLKKPQGVILTVLEALRKGRPCYFQRWRLDLVRQ